MVTNDLYGKPFQLKFVRPGQMLLFANATCDPPLGQATVVPYGETVGSRITYVWRLLKNAR